MVGENNNYIPDYEELKLYTDKDVYEFIQAKPDYKLMSCNENGVLRNIRNYSKTNLKKKYKNHYFEVNDTNKLIIIYI